MPWVVSDRPLPSSDESLTRRLVFSELFHVRRPLSIADRFLRMDAEELVSFYRGEIPLSVRLGNDEFCAPVCFALNAPQLGLPDRQPVQVLLRPDEWLLPVDVDGYAKPVIDELMRAPRTATDGKRVRLTVSRRRAGQDVLELQPVGYFNCLATNFAMDHLPQGRTETLRQFTQRQGRFEGFSSSMLSNNIGVICMVESADGMLVVQERSASAAIQNRPGGLSASVSGGLDWTDIDSLGDSIGLRSFVAGAKREVVEELGVSLQDVRFLGLMREMLRGGKPEAYFFARSSLPMSAIHKEWEKSRSRHESVALLGYEFHSERAALALPEKNSFRDRVRRLLWEVHERADLTLVTGVLLTHLLVASQTSG